MNIFINWVSRDWCFILFDDNRNIIHQTTFQILWNESSKFITLLDEFLWKHNFQYQQIDHIVCVNGPGSFTGVRTVVLAVNTLNYIIRKHITPLSYFDLFSSYPIIKSSSKRDSFFQSDAKTSIEVIQNTLILEDNSHLKCFFWENPADIFSEKKIIDNIDYSAIIKKLEFQQFSQIEPLYIKKPNIS